MNKEGTSFNNYHSKARRNPMKLTKEERVKKSREYAPVRLISAEQYAEEKKS